VESLFVLQHGAFLRVPTSTRRRGVPYHFMQALPILAASSGATEIVEKRANQSGQKYRLTAKLLLLQLSDYPLAVNKNKNTGTAFKRSRVHF
jgi:hypothetical protein